MIARPLCTVCENVAARNEGKGKAQSNVGEMT
jgi:hypothetical protein